MKKIHLFILLQLVWISIFVTGILYFNKPTPLPEVNNDSVTTITIFNGKPKNGHLEINPDTTIRVYANTEVKWVIDSTSNVESFRIKKKWLSSDIFDEHQQPPSSPSRSSSGTVGKYKNKTYNYKILWTMKKDKSRQEYTFDPKLAIKPTFNVFHVIISIFAGIISIFSLFLLGTKKEKITR